MTSITQINQADLYFIMPLSRLLELDRHADQHSFLDLLRLVQADEFAEDFCRQVDRRLLFEGSGQYASHSMQVRLYGANFHAYSASIVYIQLSIDGQAVSTEDFANLINGTNVLRNVSIEGTSIGAYLQSIGIEPGSYLFLLNQLLETTPALPSAYDEGMAFIEANRQHFHQMLVRSDAYHEHLRIDNHEANFESIANFYGTIDLVSPVSLLQVYQYPLRSIADRTLTIDSRHRACWWLTLTDIIFIQRIILTNVLKHISELQHDARTNIVRRLNDLDRILLEMNGFWYFEDFTHEISKKVVGKVKEHVGIDGLLEKVQHRLASVENASLREINEEQNRQNHLLNMILLLIAGMQVVPLVYQVMRFLYVGDKPLTTEQLLLWLQSFGIAILVPLLVWKGRAMTSVLLGRRRRSKLLADRARTIGGDIHA